MTTTLGIIAGEGQFPFLIAAGAKRQGLRVAVVGFKGHTRPELEAEVCAMKWLKLGQLGKLLAFFKRQKVEEVVLAGAIDKPRALSIRPDFRAARILFSLKSRNDNTLLKAVAREIEKEGMRVASPLTYVPELAMPAGCLTRRSPSRKESDEIRFGWPVAKTLGELDIGQCLVVKEKMVVAVEAIEGTNATITRAGQLGGVGCVVIKVFKPGQEADIDQPSVGPETIRTMAAAGATCLAVEAGKSLFFDPVESVALADRHDIAIIGWSED